MKTVALGCVGLCLALVGGAKAYQEAPVVDGGSVVGRVRITGEITPLMPQPVYKENQRRFAMSSRDSKKMAPLSG